MEETLKCLYLSCSDNCDDHPIENSCSKLLIVYQAVILRKKNSDTDISL